MANGQDVSEGRATAGVPDLTPIRGRWTIESLEPWATYNGGDGNASVIGPTANEPVEVVPVPDEQAIERAAKALSPVPWDAPGMQQRWREYYLRKARDVLAAALEHPE